MIMTNFKISRNKNFKLENNTMNKLLHLFEYLSFGGRIEVKLKKLAKYKLCKPAFYWCTFRDSNPGPTD